MATTRETMPPDELEHHPQLAPTPCPSDADAWKKFLDDLQISMTQRLHAEVRKLQAAGIIDEHGNLLNDELPPDMWEGSETTLGDW